MIYVYLWLRPCGTPFYVGLGHADRAWSQGRNRHTDSVRRKIEENGQDVDILILPCRTREDAGELESILIAHYGRLDLGTGPLTNMTDGGEHGCPGNTWNKGRVHGPETRVRMSSARVGNTNALGKKMPDSMREKVSEALKGNQHLLGHRHSEDTKRKISEGCRMDDERRERHRQRMMGNKNTLGMKMSDETRAKMSLAQKARQQRERDTRG
jgi:hypothetical protein